MPFLINDRLDVALAVGCEGVHIGQDDMGKTFEISTSSASYYTTSNSCVFALLYPYEPWLLIKDLMMSLFPDCWFVDGGICQRVRLRCSKVQQCAIPPPSTVVLGSIIEQ